MQEVEAKGGDGEGPSRVVLDLELAHFPHAVIYQQAAVQPGPGPSPLMASQSRGPGAGEAPSDGGSLIILQVRRFCQETCSAAVYVYYRKSPTPPHGPILNPHLASQLYACNWKVSTPSPSPPPLSSSSNLNSCKMQPTALAYHI